MNLDFEDFAYKKFRRLIFPYVVTAILIFFVQLIIELSITVTTVYSGNHNLIFSIKQSLDYSNPFILNGGKQYLLDLCYGSGLEVTLLPFVIKPMSLIWFLPALFFADIIFYFFIKLFEKHSVVVQSIIVILLTLTGYIIGRYIALPWSIDVSLVAQVFVFSGYLMQKHKIYEYKASVLLYIAAASIWSLDLYTGRLDMNSRIYNNLAVSIIGAIAASYLIMNLSYVLSKSTSFHTMSISYIGRQSLVILCFASFDTLTCIPLIKYFALACLYQNNHWIILTGFRLCYSLLVAEIIKSFHILKLIYYPKIPKTIKA